MKEVFVEPENRALVGFLLSFHITLMPVIRNCSVICKSYWFLQLVVLLLPDTLLFFKGPCYLFFFHIFFPPCISSSCVRVSVFYESITGEIIYYNELPCLLLFVIASSWLLRGLLIYVILQWGRSKEIDIFSVYKALFCFWMQGFWRDIIQDQAYVCCTQLLISVFLWVIENLTIDAFKCNTDLPKVRWVLPDSYLDVKNKDYGGKHMKKQFIL